MGSKSGKRRIPVAALIGTALEALPLVWFFTHSDLYHNVIVAADGSTQTKVAFLKIAIMILLGLVGAASLWVPCFLTERQRRYVGILGFFLTSVVCIFALEYANIRKPRMPLALIRAIGKKKFLMTWAVVFLLALWFAVLVNRWQTASILTAVTVCLFGCICYFVYALRGEALIASDLTVVGTAANVAAGYEYRINSNTLILVMFTLVWCYLIIWSGFVKVFSGWKGRVVTLVIVIALTILEDRVYLHTRTLRNIGVTLNTFRPEKSYGNNGSILTFLYSAQLMVVEEPEGYSLDRVREIESRYMKETPAENVSAAQTEEVPGAQTEAVPGTKIETEPVIQTEAIPGTQTEAEPGTQTEAAKHVSDTRQESSDHLTSEPFRPNIIFVMDEAFTDMQSYMDFETDKEVCPFFDSLEENTIRGKLYVSSYGGRTANTEYEVLTGDSVGFTPPSSTPYQLYIKEPMPNLNSALENEGYRHTVGMHPYKPSGYNRKNVYELFGFDNLLFIDDFQDAETIFGRVSDDADIDRVISEYEEAKAESDEPFFVYDVTMQNHSPYIWNIEELPEEDRVHVVSGTGNYPEADLYLSLAHKSDQALEKLVHYFEQTDDPTVIVFFGDHQPALPDDFYQMALGKTKDEMAGEERMQLYHSDYVIWANFDLDEKEMDLSTNYLAPVLKQETGMELTGYDRFLLDLKEDLPIVTLNGFWDKDGVYEEHLENPDSPWYDRLQEYDMLVYNHLFDEDNCTADFFGGSVTDEAPA